MAHRGKGAIQERAIEIIGDPDREFVVNQYLVLEVLPKAMHFNKEQESKFYRAYIDNAVEVVDSAKGLSDDALALAVQHGLGAIDALHATCALKTRVAEFVTTESSTKPLLKIPGLPARSIADPPKQSQVSRWKHCKKCLGQLWHEVKVRFKRTSAAWRRR